MKKGILKHHVKTALKAVITLIIGLMSLPIFGATYYTRQSGNWNNIHTWSTIGFRGALAGTIPGAGDDVIIDRYEVVLDAVDVTVATVQVVNMQGFFGTSAKLTIQSGKKLTTTGDFTVTMENVNRTVTLEVKDNLTELEVMGNLNFTRVPNFIWSREFVFNMRNASIVTVHGNYVVNSPVSGSNLFQYAFNQYNNSVFHCMSDVIFNISDSGYHIIITDNSGTWQVDGNLTINNDGDEDFWFLTGVSSQLSVLGNLTINLNGKGGLELGAGNTAGFNQFHIAGNFLINHNTGGSIKIQNSQEGDLKVDGDFTIDWNGSFGANKMLRIRGFQNSKFDVDGSVNIDVNDPNNAEMAFVFRHRSSWYVGLNNAQHTESATINLANGNSLIMDLDEDSKMTVYGDLNTTSNGIGDMQFRLNENINGSTSDGQLDVQRHWTISKTNGKSLNLIIKNNSDILVRGNLSISNTGFNNDLVFKEDKIKVFNNGKLEVWGNFSMNIDDGAKKVSQIVELLDNARMNTGTFTNNSTTLTATNARSILVYLSGTSRWNASGDFNFKCLSASGHSGLETYNSAQLNIGRHLKVDNTSNNTSLGFTVIGANSIISVRRNIDFTKVFRQFGGYIYVTNGTFRLGGNILRNAAPNMYGYIEVGILGAVLELNGTSPQIIPKAFGNTLYGNKVYGVLLLNNTSNISPQFTLEGDIDIHSIQINANNNLKIGADKSMTVSSKITNNGTITVENNASIVQTNVGVNTNVGAGTYQIKRTGKNLATGYNIWSSPITSANLVSVFNGSNPCDMYVFQAPSQSWSYDYPAGFSTTCGGNVVTFQAVNVIAGGDGTMDVGRGYFAPGNAVSTKTFSGTINNGTVTTPISTTALGNNPNWNNDDWNLVGNPYPSAINAAAFWAENAITNARITDGIYYWDDSDPIGGANAIADYAYWNMAGGVNSGNSDKTPNGHIASGQGFWVAANANTNLVFNNSMRSNQNNQFFKTNQVAQNHNAWFSLTSPSQIENNILVGFNPEATDTIDQIYDAHKLEAHQHLRFSSVINNQEFVIQSQSMMQFDETRIIPLVLFTDEYGMHTISEYQRENLSGNYKIFLHDKFQGTMHDLSQGDFVVELQPNIAYEARFELVIRYELNAISGSGTKGTTTAIADATKSDYLVFQNNSELIITNQNGKPGVIQVFDMSGKLLLQSKIGNADLTLNSWSKLTAGSYVITISNSGDIVFRKNEIRL